MSIFPHIEGALGLVWKKRKGYLEARWQARTDLIRQGHLPQSAWLWRGNNPNEIEREFIRSRCVVLQQEMLNWSRPAVTAKAATYDGTLGTLIACYRADPISTYQKLRYKTRETYDHLCKRILADRGAVRVADIKYRTLLEWHADWSAGDRMAIGHSLMGMLRTLIGFGTAILEDSDCARVSGVLSTMRIAMPRPRTSHLTADQAALIRAKAHDLGLHSIALAQAFQFEAMLRQKDVIGEWVPMTEPGVSAVLAGNSKWLRGIRWEEIDADLVLHHVTSKRNKLVEPPLREGPMVMEEFARIGELPKSGPVIVSEFTGVPWTNSEFRRQWRKVARACGIPDTVRNMDSRAGGITEASDAGAPLEHIRHAATHSNTATTQNYSRNSQEKVESVMKLRAAHRAARTA